MATEDPETGAAPAEESQQPAVAETGTPTRWIRLKKLAENRRGTLSAKILPIPGAQPRLRFNPPESSGHPNTAEQIPSHDSTSDQERYHAEPKEVILANPVFAGFMLTTGIGLALLCLYVLTNIGALAGWIVGALFIALGLDPAVRRLEKWGMPRVAGVFTVVSVFALAVIGILSWIIPKIASQTVELVNGFPNMLNQFLDSDFFKSVDQQFQIRSWVDHEVQDIFSKITGDSNIVSGFLNNLINAGSTVANTITGTIIVLFLSLYFLSSLPLMKAWLVRLAPATRRNRIAMLTEKITGSVGNYVMGQAIVALLNGTYALIVMSIVGVPFPQLLTLFVVILAFIPLIGGVSAGILVSLLALLSSWQTAAIYAICYFAYLQVEAYFISPRIMAKAVAVPGGVAIIAVAAGGALWGVLGALIAIPVAASLLILVQEVLVPRQDRN